MASYLSSKVKIGTSKKSGKGLFAIDKIQKGEIVIDYKDGIGKYVNHAEAEKLWLQGIDYDIQIKQDLFFVPSGRGKEIEEADYLNHSCNPTCGIRDVLKIVAMRDIEKGEEITFDYAMSESYPYNMKCNCGEKNCRGNITGDDWERPELQTRYKGYFSDYINKMIDSL